MKIERFFVDRFGCLRDTGIERMPLDLAVLVGANEAGKTTLTEFLRWMMLGTPTGRGAVSNINSFGRSDHSEAAGRLTLRSVHGSALTVERSSSVSEPSIHPPSSAAILNDALAGMDRTTFDRIFAIGLTELQGLDLLSDDRLRSRLLSTGMDAVFLPRALAELDRRLAGLAGSARSTRPRINALTAELAEADRRIRDARSTSDRYQGLLDERAQIESAVDRIDRAIETARDELEDVTQLVRVADPWLRRAAARSALDDLGGVAPIPSDTLARYESLRRRLTDRPETAGATETNDTSQAARSTGHPEVVRRATMAAGSAASGRSRSGRRLGFSLVLLLALIGALAATLSGNLGLGASAVLIAVAAITALWWSSRSQRVERIDPAPEAGGRFAPADDRATALAGMRQLLIEVGVETESKLLARVQATEMAEQARAEIARQDTRLAALLDDEPPAAVGSAQDRSSQSSDRADRADLPDRKPRLERLHGLETGGIQQLRAERDLIEGTISALETDRAETLRSLGAIDHEIERLERKRDLARVLAERAAIEASLARAIRDWATVALAQGLIEEARDRFERDHLPRLLHLTEHFLHLMVGDDGPERRYQLALEDGTLQLLDRRSRRRSEAMWSHGLADQIYLSLRIAMALERARRAEPLPLILDDVHVRFDAVRRRGLARALVELAGELQVVVVSGQPELVEDLALELRSTAPLDAGVFEIEDGEIGTERALETV